MKERLPEGENNSEIIGEIITYCRDKGFKPVLITTPFTDYYNYWFSGDIHKDFKSDMLEISERYDVPYLDYSRDPRFTKRLDLFADSDHLNPVGRKMFTEILLRDLGII